MKCSNSTNVCIDNGPWSRCSTMDGPVVSIVGDYFWLHREQTVIDGCALCHNLLWLTGKNIYECLHSDTHKFRYQIIELNGYKLSANLTAKKSLIKINCKDSVSYYKFVVK
jgi:hypothetical protein